MKSRPRRFVRSGLRGYHCPQFTSGDLAPINVPCIRSELTGQLTPIHTGTRHSSRAWANSSSQHAHQWRQGWSHGWRSPSIRRDTAPATGRPREVRSRAPVGRRGDGEAEGCPRRGDRARRHQGRPVASRLADWAGRRPGAGAWRLCRRRRALLNRPGGSGTETTTAPQPRVEQIPHGVAEHVEAVHGNRQAKTRPESQPWRHLHV